MEENPGHLKSQKDESDLKDPLVQETAGEEIDLSNDDNEKTQEKQEADGESSKANEEHDKSPTTRETNSPDASCPICLGALENKSFTDSCFHTFCFTCLLEWSKVKAECPLCKQKFKSIVHNVRSIKDYDQYFISSTKSSESYVYSIDGRRFRYQSTMTTERVLERRRRIELLHESLENRIASHRLLFAPHSVRTYTSSEVARVPCNFRLGIYETDIWVRPHHGSRRQVRNISPAFYRDNPACTHRLIPWLNRELVALLHNSESQITFVLELIMALIMRYEIQSHEFYVQLEPYLGRRTGHFIHEFYNFACSPYEMARYDRYATYDLSPQEPINLVNCSSPGSDVISLTDSVNHAPSTSNESHSSHQAKKPKQANKRLKKLVLKRNHENDSWQPVIPFQASSSSSSLNSPSFTNSETVSDFYNIPGPSTSTYEMSYCYDTSIDVSTSYHNNPGTSHDVDNECLIVDEVPPKAHRIAEIIDLLSSDEEKAKDATEKRNKSYNNVASSSSTSNRKFNNYNDIITLSSDENSVDRYPQDKNRISYSSSDTFVYTSIGSDVDEIVQEPVALKKSKKLKLSCEEDTKTDSDGSTNEHHSISNPSNLDSKYNKQTAWSPQNNDGSYSSSITSIAGYESSTDSCSEFSSSSHKPKKQKLRSVVAQVSKDHHYERSDSSHHSSHKRHKEKHKKKKKHSRKHRHCSRSYESE